jgi:hypothetical protein
LKRFLLIASLIIGLDQTIGFLLNRLYLQTTSGDNGGVINGVLRRNADVLVLGSSRARHHVLPVILKERMSVSVFNAGINGQGFLYAFMLLDLWTRSHVPPKAILLHVDPTSLSYSEEELARTHIFSGYFRESERVRSILLMRGKYEWLKYLSSSYRFNGKVLPIIKNLTVRYDDTIDGYIGLKGSLEPGSISSRDPRKSPNEDSASFWDLKLSYLAELARYCKTNGTRLILFHSPRFQEDPETLAIWSRRLSALLMPYEGVEFLDLAAHTDELFAGRPDLFKDEAHLNERGSEVFSRLLADEVASRLGSIATN